MTLIVNLDVVLAKRKMRMGDLARAIGITQANLSNLKNGRARGVRFSTLDAICRELGCQPADLLAHAPDADGRHSTSQPRSRSAAP